MLSFISNLFSKNEAEVDSILVAGLLALVVLLGITIYVVIKDHTVWSPLTYTTSIMQILGSIAGGKRLRDGSPTSLGNPSALPDSSGKTQ